MSDTDFLVRMRDEAGTLRALAITSKHLVEAKRKQENLSPIAAAALGRLMSAALMMGDWLKGENDTLTLEISGEGELSHLVAVSNAKGEVRGYVSNPSVILPPNENGHLAVGKAIGKGRLIVIRDLGLKRPYVSATSLVSGEIAEDLTYYVAQSEQTPSSVGLGVRFDPKTVEVISAGGFLIQLLPGCPESTISCLEKNLASFSSVTEFYQSHGDDPALLLRTLLAGLSPIEEGKKEVRWHCSCSKDRAQHTLSSLPKKDLEEMANDTKDTEIVCEFCGKSYRFSPQEIQAMIDAKEAKQ